MIIIEDWVRLDNMKIMMIEVYGGLNGCKVHNDGGSVGWGHSLHWERVGLDGWVEVDRKFGAVLHFIIINYSYGESLSYEGRQLNNKMNRNDQL